MNDFCGKVMGLTNEWRNASSHEATPRHHRHVERSKAPKPATPTRVIRRGQWITLLWESN